MFTPQGLSTHEGGLSTTASNPLSLILSETPQQYTPQESSGLPIHERRLDCLVGSVRFTLISPTRLSVEDLMSVLLEFLTAKNEYSCIKNSFFVGANMVSSSANMVSSAANMVSSGANVVSSGVNVVRSGAKTVGSGANSVSSAANTRVSGNSLVSVDRSLVGKTKSLPSCVTVSFRSFQVLGLSLPCSSFSSVVRLCGLTESIEEGCFVYSGSLVFTIKGRD